MIVREPAPPLHAYVIAALAAPLAGGLIVPPQADVSRPFILVVSYLFGLPLAAFGLLLVAAPIAAVAARLRGGLSIGLCINGGIAALFAWYALTANWPMADVQIMLGAGGASAAITFSILWLIHARKVSHA